MVVHVEQNKGCESIGKAQCHVIRYPSAREDSDCIFGARWLSIKYFPRKLRILVSVNAFPLSWQINSAAKKFNLFLHQIVVNDDVIVIFFLLLFLSIVVHVLCPQISHVIACKLHTKHSKKERKERSSESVNKRDIVYIPECSICK